MNERDRKILEFVAKQRLVLASHLQPLLGVSDREAHERLVGLASGGLLKHDRLVRSEPGCYRITRAGLTAIGSDLPPPRLDLRRYRHDTGVPWIWLAASHGAFGRIEHVMTERELRSRDNTTTAPGQTGKRDPQSPRADRNQPPFGVPVAGASPDGPARPHYPDLMLILEPGRVPIQLHLSSIGRRRLETILTAYGAAPNIAAVLYLVEDPTVSRTVRTAAARVDLSRLIHVQFVDPSRTTSTATPT